MRTNHFIALLDTCVLVPMPIADTLLRMAEEPAFYLPRWSADILRELEGALVRRLNYTEAQAARRVTRMIEAFPDAIVEGYESLIPSMQNHEKDRHVLAAAIKAGSHAIVTNNKKHFPQEITAAYHLECLTANEFISHQYHLDPDRLIALLHEQARDAGIPFPNLIRNHVPCLTELIHS